MCQIMDHNNKFEYFRKQQQDDVQIVYVPAAMHRSYQSYSDSGSGSIGLAVLLPLALLSGLFFGFNFNLTSFSILGSTSGTSTNIVNINGTTVTNDFNPTNDNVNNDEDTIMVNPPAAP